MVRAIRTGSWDGHRRRAGAVFPVRESADEKWFEYVGPAPTDAEIPGQLMTAQGAPAKTFVGVMKEMGNGENAPKVTASQPATLAAAGAMLPSSEGSDLV